MAYTNDQMQSKRFGRLVVVAEAPRFNGRDMWFCKCDCGQTKTIAGRSLRSKNTSSCGCLQKEKTIANNKRNSAHGMCHTKIHRVWLHIKDRCNNSNCKSYCNYGARGILICDEWKNDFQAFYDYVSQLPHFGEEGYSLDRINNDGNYEPNNIRWATRKEQANNKRTNRFLEAFGEKHTVSEWSDILGISSKTILSRLRKGLTDIEALTIESEV